LELLEIEQKKYLIEHFLHYLGRRQAGVWMAGTDEAIVMQMVDQIVLLGRHDSTLISHRTFFST
jgi:hypothetical protein